MGLVYYSKTLVKFIITTAARLGNGMRTSRRDLQYYPFDVCLTKHFSCLSIFCSIILPVIVLIGSRRWTSFYWCHFLVVTRVVTMVATTTLVGF